MQAHVSFALAFFCASILFTDVELRLCFVYNPHFPQDECHFGGCPEASIRPSELKNCMAFGISMSLNPHHADLEIPTFLAASVAQLGRIRIRGRPLT